MLLLLIILGLLTVEETSPTTTQQLLFANRRDLRSLQLSNISKRHNVSILIQDLSDATSLDYSNESICWSDIKEEAIKCKTGSEISTLASFLPAPEDIAIDWICNNLYWTDSDTNRIEVVSLAQPHYRRVIVYEELDQPRAIVLDSNEGLFFWSDWGEVPKIEQAELDGWGRRVLHSTQLQWPNGLALDLEKKKIYWIDGRLLQIGFSDYDGGRRGRLEQGTSLHPFSLVFSPDLGGGTLIWSDWNTNSLHYMPITTPTPPRQLLLFRSSNLQPMDIILKQDRPITRTCPLCSHLTLLKNASHTCSCPTGVGSIQNSCKSSIEKFLLIARSTEIRLLSLDVPSPDVDMSIPGLKHVLSIDYYNKTIYYTDDELRRVASYSMDTKRTNMIVSTEIIHPDGLCIDKASKQIYWTDAGTDKIEVCSIDGRYRKSVVSRGLYEPRALAVDSLNGLLFWSDWGRRPKIEYSYLDGSERTILVNTDIEWPNGLAVDEDMKKLYFCDASTDRIESINYNGGGRIILLQSIPHPFGFSYMDPFLYWSDWQSRTIERIKYDGSGREVLLDPFPDPMGLRTVGGKIYKNSCYNCSQLCFYNGTHANCACGNGFELVNSYDCVISSDYIVYNRNGDIYKLSKYFIEEQIHISKLRQPVAIAINDYLYWSEGKTKAIMRANVYGWGAEKLIDNGGHIECIYISGGLIYWSDSSGGRIEAATTTKPYYRSILLNVESPKSVTISNYKLYYTSWGSTPHIGVANSDGSEAQIYLKTGGRANSLQFSDEWLYFANVDGGAIERYDGVRREIIARGESLYTLVIWGEDLLYSDLATNQLFIKSKNATRVLLDSVEILDMHVHRGSNISSKCEDSNCTHLCFESSIGYKCACPTHYELLGNKCVEPSRYLLIANQNSILRYVNSTEVYISSNLKKLNRRIAYYRGKLLTNDEEQLGSLGSEFTIVNNLIYYYTNGYINVTADEWSGWVYKVEGARNLISTSSNLYFSIGNIIYRLDLDGYGELSLNTSVTIQCLGVGEKLYFYGEGGFYTSDLDLSSYKVLFHIDLVISRFVLYDGIYYVSGGRLEYINLDGSGRRRIGGGEWGEGVGDLVVVEAKATTCGGCSHICLAKSCSCPRGLVLQNDDNCVRKPDHCPAKTVPCQEGPISCIREGARCDDFRDCRDGSDEEGCCGGCDGGYECGGLQEGGCPLCLLTTQICNGHRDCLEGEDESNCPSSAYKYAAPITVVLLLIVVGVGVWCGRRGKRSYLQNVNNVIGGTADSLLQPSTTLPPTEYSPILPPLYMSGPPPTPCSTDVCDESEVYVPPPPSPHTSSNSSRYFCNGSERGERGGVPGAPPPSPVLE